MTTFILIAVGFGFIWGLVTVSRKWGEAKVKEKDLMGEIKSARKANEIENDHKHDSRNDIIDGL